MSEVANKDLCAELHELSGWDDVMFRYHESGHLDGNLGVYTVYDKLVSVRESRVGCDECEGQYAEESRPAYTLGYLLRKLPATLPNEFDGGSDYLILYLKDKKWCADYMGQFLRAIGDTPEDAACLLAIELFKQRILTK